MSQSDQVLRTGVLFKKGSGAGPFGRKNWKPRYFVLTPSKLKYYTFEDGDLKGEVDLTGCDEGMLEVMPMDSMKTGSSASTIWRIAVNAPERRLLVAAGTEMEMNDWVDKLMMAFRINNGQPMHLPQRGSLSHAPPSAIGNGYSAAPGSSNSNGSGAGVSITDFQNFTAPRRLHHGAGRQSLGGGGAMSESQQHHSYSRGVDEQLSEQLRRQSLQQSEHEATLALARQELELEELRREEREREEAYQLEQTRRYEEAKRQEAEAEAARQLQLEREAEAAAQARRYHEEALRQQQLEEEAAAEAALKRQLMAAERESEQERRLSMQQNQEALLDEQRRRKREQHERERAQREHSMRVMEEQQRASEAAEEYDLDAEFELDDASAAPATPPRSSLIDDVKRDAQRKQQMEHQRRREAALKDEQRRQRDHALEQKLAAAQGTANAFEREVEIPPRVVEVVRRAPPAPVAAGRQSAPKVESFEF